MRKIKFRYICKDIAGNIFSFSKTIKEMERGELNINTDGRIQEIISRDLYTGQKDKNGKEIYENDYLEGRESGEFGSTLSTWIDVIVWDPKRAAFVCMDIGAGETLGLDEIMSDKVVGNIYTHPEWLRMIREEFDALRSGSK